MTDSPIPRLSPYEVLQVLDQMILEAEEAQQMAVWKHSAVCDGFTAGIWEPDATCRDCRFEVMYEDHIEQYLLVPVNQPGAAAVEQCPRCHGLGIVPDGSLPWRNGEPQAKPCPACSTPEKPQHHGECVHPDWVPCPFDGTGPTAPPGHPD